MPDSFFQSDKKRKRQPRAGPSRGRAARPAATGRRDEDEDISSGSSDAGGAAGLDDMDFQEGRGEIPVSDDEVADANETAREKRLRLAKGYLAKVREDLEAEQGDGDYDAAEIDRELIASRLQQEVAETQGKIQSYLSAKLEEPRSRFISIPSHCSTAVTMSPRSLYISTKRGVIFRYSLPSLKREGRPFGQAKGESSGHRGEILCIAASEDGKWLVSGGRDKVVGIWNVENELAEWKTGMRGHKDAVTSVVIPPLNNPSLHFLTAALSRHLSLASLSTLSTIDTFFGHQDSIPSVSALKPTVAVTAGSRDRTCRWWKVEEEVQLVFRGGGRTFEGVKGLVPEPRKERLGGGWELEDESVEKKRQAAQRDKKGKGREFVEGSIDCVCVLDDQNFVSGGDSGSISLWHNGKKKPVFTLPLAHGIEEDENRSCGPRWITSLAHLRGTDLFASGSWDGSIRLWALDRSMRSFAPAHRATIPVMGIVNSLQLLAVPASSVDGDSAKWSEPGVDDHLDTSEGVDEVDEVDPVKQKATAGSKSNKEILLVAAVGQEPRLGRWMRLKDGVKNGALVAHLRLGDAGKSML